MCLSLHSSKTIDINVVKGGSPRTTFLQNKHPLCYFLTLLGKPARFAYAGCGKKLAHAQSTLLCLQSSWSQTLRCMQTSTGYPQTPDGFTLSSINHGAKANCLLFCKSNGPINSSNYLTHQRSRLK